MIVRKKANGAINKMAEVIIFRLNIISLYGAKKELTHRIQTVLNATIFKVLYWLFFNDSPGFDHFCIPFEAFLARSCEASFTIIITIHINKAVALRHL